MKISLFLLIAIFFILADFTATISGINTYMQFYGAGTVWSNPTTAAYFEGNPFARQALGIGLPFIAGIVVAYFIILLYIDNKYTKLRLPVYLYLISIHGLAILTWLTKQAIPFFNLTVMAFLFAFFMGFFINHFNLTYLFGIEINLRRRFHQKTVPAFKEKSVHSQVRG